MSVPSAPATGALYSFAFNNCSFSTGYVYNGSATVRFDSYTSPTTYAWTAGFDFTLTTLTSGVYHYRANQSCTDDNSAFSCLYTDGTRTFSSDFTDVNGVINGTYLWKYGNNGTVKYVFTNWSATGGSIAVTGANGSATIVRNSATSFTVTINGTVYTTS